MAYNRRNYNRRNYNRNRRNYNRNTRRPLKRGNIYKNRNALSQARQIYALKRRINYVYRMSKPEIRTFTNNLYNVITSPGDPLSNMREFHKVDYLFKDNMLSPNAPLKYYGMGGSLMRIRNIKFYGTFGFNFDALFDSADSQQAPNMNAYVKFIICRVKKGGGQVYPTQITQQINPVPSPVAENARTFTDLSLINGPLKPKVSNTFDIIKIKVIKISDIKRMRTFSFSLNKKFDYKDTILNPLYNNIQSNEIIIYTQFVAPQILIREDTTTVPPTITRLGPTVHLSLNYKVVFDDEGGIEIDDEGRKIRETKIYHMFNEEERKEEEKLNNIEEIKEVKEEDNN